MSSDGSAGFPAYGLMGMIRSPFVGRLAAGGSAGTSPSGSADGHSVGVAQQIVQSAQHTITSFRSVRLGLYSSGHGFACQMSAAYSVMVRSLENLPEWPRLRIALRAHTSGWVYREPAFSWVSTEADRSARCL